MELKVLLGDEIRDLLINIIRTELNQLNNASQVKAAKHLTRLDVAKMFGVSLVTIHNWVDAGILVSYKMNRKTYFKEDEVRNAMRQVKVKRRSI